MRWFFHPKYVYGRGMPGLPKAVHGFVRDKAARIRAALLRSKAARRIDFIRPAPVEETALAAVHTARVVASLRDREALAEAVELGLLATLPTALARALVVKPQRHATGGTCAALALAARGGWAVNLSGGFHHARPDLIHGFCLMNDVALAVHRLRAAGLRQRVLVLDLDLHQGDGNAAAFADDPTVFTASMHEEGAFPFPKLRSDLDLGLASGIGDDVYHRHLDRLLATLRERFAPEIVVYVAGTDPLEADPLGNLYASAAGLVERDRKVARYTRDMGAGLVMLPAGGYSAQSPAVAAAGMAAVAGLDPDQSSVA